MLDRKPRWEKWSIILAGIAAAVAILAYLTTTTGLRELIHGKESQPPSPTTVKNITNIVQSDGPPPGAKQRKLTDPSALPPPAITSLHTKPAFLGLQRSAGSTTYESNLSDGITGIFKNNGHDPIATNPEQKIYDFANLVCYNLSLGQPEEKKGPFDVVTYEFKVELTLQFFQGRESSPCTTLVYHALISRPTNEADTDQILQQGVTGLLNQLRNVRSFPFCMPQ